MVSGVMGSESVRVSESTYFLPNPSAGFVRTGVGLEKSAPSEAVHSCEVSISGVRPHPRAKLEREWKWAMMTSACASSDTDQLSVPRRRLCARQDGKGLNINYLLAPLPLLLLQCVML